MKEHIHRRFTHRATVQFRFYLPPHALTPSKWTSSTRY